MKKRRGTQTWHHQANKPWPIHMNQSHYTSLLNAVTKISEQFINQTNQSHQQQHTNQKPEP